MVDRPIYKPPDPNRRLTAVLGPTNTGKTHLAVERMLGHATGMIGFPLRLLARENYDRIVKAKGVESVALITGEERIVPRHPRWWVCTVESMPVDKPVEFICIDEIQLAADPDRGHVFTDRLLNARGLSETMVLGAETMKPLIKRLVPNVEFVTRPRFSSLLYTGPKKVTRLPRRSAVVAFSATEVYAIAELIRRQKGGTAVVLGALSPRARNAQVELYQSGEVDYMVATDAIGMGLNMDLDHVAFAKLSKFDGRAPRRLRAPEIAQIAGRAGRHMRDGTFGTTAEIGPLDEDLVEAVETHRFDPIEQVMWRNSELDFRSIESLLASLDQGPPHPVLKRKRDADDHQVLQDLAKQEDIRAKLKGRAALRLVWEVAQIPDFRKTLADAHVKLVGQMFLHLAAPQGRLPTDWVAGQLARLDKTDGDIDQLSQRLAHIRTWSYVAHRDDWLADPAHWQERARVIEDRLSDALHDKLTQRFVDRRGAHLIRRLEDADDLLGGVVADGTVVIEGHPVGRLDGLVFRPDPIAAGDEIQRIQSAARRVLEAEVASRVSQLGTDVDAEPGAFRLALNNEAVPAGRILWRDHVVGWLMPGPTTRQPLAEAIRSDLLSPEQRQRIREALGKWLAKAVEGVLAPLFGQAEDMPGPARGLVFQLAEALGMVPRAQVASLIDALDKPARKALGQVGVVLGHDWIFHRALQSPEAVAWRGLLAATALGLKQVPRLASPKKKGHRPQRSLRPRDAGVPDAWYHATGRVVLGGLLYPVDRAESLAALIRRTARDGAAFAPTPAIRSVAGCDDAALTAVLGDLGYRALPVAIAEDGTPAGETQFIQRRPQRRAPKPEIPAKPIDANSPFAKLKEHSLAR